ncbi:elongation factor Ts, mitochondrial-like [Oscarella lobularis]|uniref:elongation factor Ts, mitochondrial-like n=1 Tax=Oscarella lobularis TaxID=121494 RepID=UPI00331359C2
MFRTWSSRLLLFRRNLSSGTEPKVPKELIWELRKSTGYPISKCREALVACTNNLSSASIWLSEQAQKEGWTKVERLKNRKTIEGLVAITTKANVGSMIEINCETDFVSRNEAFQSFVNSAAKAFHFHSLENKTTCHYSGDDLARLSIDGMTVGSLLTSLISKLSENIILRRGCSLHQSENGVSVHGYAHVGVPKSYPGLTCAIGKYGALVAMAGGTEKLGSRIGMQIVGKNPKALEAPSNANTSFNAEDFLVSQEYLFESGSTVGDILQREKAIVRSFLRYECGEENDC